MYWALMRHLGISFVSGGGWLVLEWPVLVFLGGGTLEKSPMWKMWKSVKFQTFKIKITCTRQFWNRFFFGVEEVDFLEGVGQEKRIHVGFVYFSGHPPQNDLAPGQICWIFVWFCCCSYSSWFGCFAPMGNSCANLILALQNIRPGGAPKKHPLFGGSI